MKFNVEKIRKDFPILSQKVNGQILVYLDNAATTQKPQTVITATKDFYAKENANIHRGVYYLSEQATLKYEASRQTVAQFINAESPEIVFTRGTTEAINLVAQTWGRQNIKKNDVIVVTEMEHHSNFLPWQNLAKERAAKIRILPINEKGELIWRPQDFKGAKLLAVSGMSNVLGTINPLKELIKAAHIHGSKVLVDAAQLAGHKPIDVKSLDCDFLVFSGHKVLGPTGIGVLYAKFSLLESMPPYQYGGEMVKAVSTKETVLNDVPHKFEAGTPNIAGAIGLKAAINYLFELGWKNIEDQEGKLVKYALTGLSKIAGLKIYGSLVSNNRGPAICFSVKGIHPHDLATILSDHGVAIRSGHHCAMPLHHKLGVNATARVSLAFYNTTTEIDKLLIAIKKAQKIFDRQNV